MGTIKTLDRGKISKTDYFVKLFEGIVCLIEGPVKQPSEKRVGRARPISVVWA